MADGVDLFNTCVYVQEHLDSDLSLLALAKMAGLSRFRFHRVFKAWCGETLHDFVTRLRMERAAFELAYPAPRGRRSIKAIAYATGYKSLSSFSHAFSDYASVSPRQYRARALERARQTSTARGEFGSFSIRVTEILERPLVVVDTRAPAFGRPPHGTPAVGAIAFDSLTALRARRSGSRAPLKLTSIGVDAREWDALAGSGLSDHVPPRLPRITLRAGHYAVIEGSGSLAELYRLWCREFDSWLEQSGHCPSADRYFVSFDDDSPRGIFEVRKLALHIPLEPVIERPRGPARWHATPHADRTLISEVAHA